MRTIVVNLGQPKWRYYHHPHWAKDYWVRENGTIMQQRNLLQGPEWIPDGFGQWGKKIKAGGWDYILVPNPPKEVTGE